MFQFRNKNTAVMAAKVLAVREVRPILVMGCAADGLCGHGCLQYRLAD